MRLRRMALGGMLPLADWSMPRLRSFDLYDVRFYRMALFLGCLSYISSCQSAPAEKPATNPPDVVLRLQGNWGLPPPADCRAGGIEVRFSNDNALRVSGSGKDMTVSLVRWSKDQVVVSSEGNPKHGEITFLDDDVICWQPQGRPPTACRAPVVRCTPETRKPLTPAQQWALAAAAVLAERNHDRHDLLGGLPLSPKVREKSKRLLKDWWDITDRESLAATLSWLMYEGHNAAFAEMASAVANRAPEEIASMYARLTLDDQKRLDYVRRNPRMKSIRGWDLARFISLCRWGYAAGFITEDEAWKAIFEASRALQREFGSFFDVGINFQKGRYFWKAGPTEDSNLLHEAFVRLVNGTESPWKRIDWNTPLPSP